MRVLRVLRASARLLCCNSVHHSRNDAHALLPRFRLKGCVLSFSITPSRMRFEALAAHMVVCTRPLASAPLLKLRVCVPQVTGEGTMLFLQVLFLMWRLDGKVSGSVSNTCSCVGCSCPRGCGCGCGCGCGGC